MKIDNLVPMNLQLFAEGGEGESSVNADPVANVEPQQTEQSTTTEQTVNADKGEVTTPKVEEKVQQSAEDNAKYAAIRREAEQKARESERDKLISEMYGESHGIHTYAEYQKAVQEEQQQRQIQEYVQNNVPEDVAKEIVEGRKFREQFEVEKQTKVQAEYKQSQYNEFAKAYPDIKGEDISQEVWNDFNSGIPLVKAYKANQENETLKAKLAEYEKGAKAQEVNNKNASSSLGSLNGQGNLPVGFITKDVFEANKKDSNWMNTNYDLLTKSMNKW